MHIILYIAAYVRTYVHVYLCIYILWLTFPIGTSLAYKTQTFQAVLEVLQWFEGDQVRNVAVSL